MSSDVVLTSQKGETALLPCPFCGSTDLRREEWEGDHGAVYAIECRSCWGAAPLECWNRRSGAGAPLPQTIQEALNSGDGVYRP